MWKHHRVLGFLTTLLLLLALVLPSIQFQTQSQKQSAPERSRFAVSEHNKEANTQLELEKVVKVKEQAVASRLYYITIQVDEDGAKKLYEAKVLEQLWLDVKKLLVLEFKPAEGAPPNV